MVVSGLLFDKCVSFLIEKGWFFLVLWVLSATYIVKSKKVLGLTLSDGDKGFVLIQVAVIYVLVHHFIVFWRARSRYYNPASFTDEVYQSVRDLRDLVKDYHPKWETSFEWDIYHEKLKPFATKIPPKHSDRFRNIAVLSLKLSFIFEDLARHQTSRAGNEIQDLENEVNLLLKETTWVFRK